MPIIIEEEITRKISDAFENAKRYVKGDKLIVLNVKQHSISRIPKDARENPNLKFNFDAGELKTIEIPRNKISFNPINAKIIAQIMDSELWQSIQDLGFAKIELRRGKLFLT